MKEKLKQLLADGRGKFFANTGWIMFDKLFHMALSLVIMSITARYLGTDNYGILNYGLSFVNIFVTVCKLGIDSILVAELVKDKGKRDELIGSTIVLRILSGFCGILLTGIFVLILKPGNSVIFWISLIESISLIFNAFDTIDFYFQSRLESKYSAISRSVAYIFVCLLRVVLVLCRANVVWFAAATIVDALTIAAGLLYFYRKVGCGCSFQKGTARELLRCSRPFILANMLVVIYTQMDKIMIGSLSTDSQVGIYTAAMNIANMWVFVPNAIIDSSRPIIMQNKHAGSEKYLPRFRQLLAAINLMGLAAGLLFTIFPRIFVLILYGEKYIQAVPILMVLIWSRMFSLMGTARTIWLICENKQRYVKWFVGMGALLNVVLNGLMIPSMGGLGAAVATLLTEIVGALVLPLCFRETREVVKLCCSLKVKRSGF